MAQCSTCGFLAIKKKETGELVSADNWVRDKGGIEPIRSDFFQKQIYCAALVCDLEKQAEAIRPNETMSEDKRLEVIKRDRPECEKDSINRWIQWVPMLTLREHREMLDRQWMIEQENKRVTADQQFRTTQARLEASRRRAELRTQQRGIRQQAKADKWQLIILGGVLGIITLLGAALESEWIPNPPWASTRNPQIVVPHTPTPVPPTPTQAPPTPTPELTPSD